jgi:hypothetical protein
MGAQLSEVLNAASTSSEEDGFSRRTVFNGVAWSVPVIVAAVGAPPASASPPPTIKPTASFSPGTATLLSTKHPTGNGHIRNNVAVPTTLSLKDFGGITDSVSVVITISPLTTTTGDPAVSFSSVTIGGNSVAPVLALNGTTFTATFTHAVAVGSKELNFGISGYAYDGKSTDRRTFQVVAAISYKEGTKDETLSATYQPITL